ncbi:hypothetical protein E2C01_028405 [Portunus trituberculatus]|uniref:Uncharacterized protein n=1 Tax=Portunus trituberculatus TaxID=210409 RepID=A0A5B7EP21_PORTR|nr:hypothetical protein [Portunus trituberculatus]
MNTPLPHTPTPTPLPPTNVVKDDTPATTTTTATPANHFSQYSTYTYEEQLIQESELYVVEVIRK